MSENKRVTVEALRLYVPLFQVGDKAEHELKNESSSTVKDTKNRAILLSSVGLKKYAYDELTELTYPLMRKEIQMAIRNSHLKREEEEIFSVIYYAGLGGMERGLRKFDVEKIEESATNYLFQWIMVYAKKELLRLEAPMGIPPTRFQKHKKIAAVRKKLSDLLDRPATNSEILEYFHTGKAEFRSYNGPKIKAIGVSDANKKITMELIEEQEEIEKNLSFAQIFDSAEDYRAERLLSVRDKPLFSETLIGSFVSTMRFSAESVAILKSDLQQDTTREEDQILKNVSTSRHQAVMKTWRDYLGDPRGDFRDFLESERDSGSSEHDVEAMLRSLGPAPKNKRTSQPARYNQLFGK